MLIQMPGLQHENRILTNIQRTWLLSFASKKWLNLTAANHQVLCQSCHKIYFWWTELMIELMSKCFFLLGLSLLTHRVQFRAQLCGSVNLMHYYLPFYHFLWPTVKLTDCTILCLAQHYQFLVIWKQTFNHCHFHHVFKDLFQCFHGDCLWGCSCLW